MNADGQSAWRYDVRRRMFRIVDGGAAPGPEKPFWCILATDPDGNVFICPNVYRNEDEAAETAAMLGPKPPSDIDCWRVVPSANRHVASATIH